MNYKYTINAIKSEFTKLKSTTVLWMCILFPTLVVVTYFLIYFSKGNYLLIDGVNPWLSYSAHTLGFWSVFVLPVYITMTSSLICEIENRANSWKQILVYPIPNSIIYSTKLFVLFVLTFFSQILLYLLMIVLGFILGLTKPEYGFQFDYSSFKIIFFSFPHLFICSILITVIHFMISLYRSQLLFSIIIGFTLTIMNLIISNTSYGDYFPWSHSAIIIGKKIVNIEQGLLNIEIANILIGGLLGFIAIKKFSTKDNL